jgi:hypothetical protein
MLVTIKNNHLPGRSGERRSRISRARIAGSKPWKKCPSRS